MSKKITELTEEQEALFPEYVSKWIGVGTNTDRLDYDNTLDIIHSFQKNILKKDLTPVVIVNNPIEAWVGCCLIVMEEATVNNVSEKIKEFFKGNPKGWDLPNPNTPYQTGSFFSPYFSFYDYMLNEVDIDIDPEIKRKYFIWQRLSELGIIFPLDNVVIVSEKPKSIHLNGNKLHYDGGPALEYDGYGNIKIYSLNGVNVPKYLAVTPAQDLDFSFFTKEKNADIKAEFVRKVGIERLLDHGKKIDSYENYNHELD